MHPKVEALLGRLSGVVQHGQDKWQALCPVHGDDNPSLSIDVRGNRILLHCFGCQTPAEEIIQALGLTTQDLFLDTPGVSASPETVVSASPETVVSASPTTNATATIALLAQAKGIPEDFLRELGLEDVARGVGIPYLLADGTQAPRQRLRTSMAPGGAPRWLGTSGKPVPYGLWRLAEARQAGYIVIVEGESDCWTLWYRKVPALGVPGASMVNLLTAEMFAGIPNVYVVRENDPAGQQFATNVPAKLRSLRCTSNVRVVELPEGVKDPNDLFKQDTLAFRGNFINLLDQAPVAAGTLLSEFEWLTLDQLMHQGFDDELWLVEDFWTQESYGIIAGEPKTYKSVLTTDLAVSVATGLPFLGSMRVVQTGPVLMVQNENNPRDIQDRLYKILQAKTGRRMRPDVTRRGRTISILPTPPLDDIPVHLLSREGFDLTSEAHWSAMLAKVEETEPVLVVLDPLYLMLGGASVNEERELRPILQRLIQLSRTYRLSIVVVHHFNKGGSSSRGGQRLLGSTTLHGWLDSGAYLRWGENPQQDESSIRKLLMERQLRVGVLPELEVSFNLGRFGDDTYEVGVVNSSDADWRRVLHLLAQHDSLQNREVRELLTCGSDRATTLMTMLCTRGLAQMVGAGRSTRMVITDQGLQESQSTTLRDIAATNSGGVIIHTRRGRNTDGTESQDSPGTE